MTGAEAIAYIEDQGWSRTRLGLARTRELMERLDHPERKLRFIHVAGSNGKGSTCAMLECILRSAGYVTGLYISPHLERFHERMQVCGVCISDEELGALTALVREKAEGMSDHPSQFELSTAVAMLYFVQHHCDIRVLEVGMGGALDATNVIEAPELAILCHMALEHTEYLGDTLEAITTTKAGILKPGCDCIVYPQTAEVVTLLQRLCQEKQIPCHVADAQRLQLQESNFAGQRFTWDGVPYVLRLCGRYQLYNAAVALTSIEVLRTRGFAIPEAAVHAGLQSVQWPARLERLSETPFFLLDGCHNQQGAQALCETLQASGERYVFLVGVLEDKDYEAMMDCLLPLSVAFVCVTPDSPRALPGKRLEAYLRAKGAQAVALDAVEAGIEQALACADNIYNNYRDKYNNKYNYKVVCCGSLYLAGAVRGRFAMACRSFLRHRGDSARRRMEASEREAASFAIAQAVAALPAFQRARTVMLYRALPWEVSLEPIQALAPDKCYVYPRCERDRQLSVYEPGGFLPGPWGIAEPDPERSRKVDREEIDLVLCPAAALDGAGHRLGMGAGYYDRFLAGMAALRVGVVFDAQMVPEIVPQPQDIAMDFVVTEHGVYSCHEA